MKDREEIYNSISDGKFPELKTPGELNWYISCALIRYINDHGLSYQHINDCLGALEGVKQEFYRKVAVPYEEKKIVVNGDLEWPK